MLYLDNLIQNFNIQPSRNAAHLNPRYTGFSSFTVIRDHLETQVTKIWTTHLHPPLSQK